MNMLEITVGVCALTYLIFTLFLIKLILDVLVSLKLHFARVTEDKLEEERCEEAEYTDDNEVKDEIDIVKKRIEELNATLDKDFGEIYDIPSGVEDAHKINESNIPGTFESAGVEVITADREVLLDEQIKSSI